MFGAGREAAMNPERPLASLATAPSLAPRVSSELVVRALNYHGQQLTSFLKESPLYENLDLRAVDYHLYHQRSRELRMEDRGKRLLLHRFISQKVDKLFTEQEERVVGRREVRHQVEEHAALLPPLEAFAEVDEDDRCRHFFELVAPGDTVYCRIVSKSASGLMLSVLCLDPITGKSRYIEDVKIRCFCPSAEMVPPDPKDPGLAYEGGDLVRVVVLEVKVESQRLLAGMHSTSLPPLSRSQVKLGLVKLAELPAAHTFTGQARAKQVPYSSFLERSVGFSNPTAVAHLAGELGLPLGAASLAADLADPWPPEAMVASIRREQASKWAFKHVAQGIKYFKQGNSVEAFQCLNQALKIDESNVEGLVARGALFANNGGLEKAVADFEAALLVNPTHRNAKKYMCETLIAVARNFEDEEKVAEAIETYERILRVVPDHREAVDSLLFLRGRPKDAPLRDDLAGRGRDADKNKPKLRLEEEEKRERRNSRSEKKKKKRRRRSSSGSTASSGSASDASRSRKVRRKARASPSLSPFSSKLAPSNVPAAAIVLDTPPEAPPAAAELPDLRQSIDKLRSGGSGEAASFVPLIDLTQPPPGYLAAAAAADRARDREYDSRVAEFLEKTAAGGSNKKVRKSSVRSGRSRSRSKGRSRRRSRSKERSSRRSRSKGRSSSKGGSGSKQRDKSTERSRKRSGSPKSKTREKKSRSRERKSKSKSRERKPSSSSKKEVVETKEVRRSVSSDVVIREGKEVLLDDDDFTKRLDEQLAQGERRGGWTEVAAAPAAVEERVKAKARPPVVNVFSDDDEKEEKKSKKAKRPSGGGMWLPTGEDSIIEGVKEAADRLLSKEEKRRRAGEEARRRTTDLPQPPPEYTVSFDTRTGMYLRVPKVQAGTMAERVAHTKVPKMDEKEVEAEMVERVVRKLESTPPRMPKKKSKSRSRSRRRSGESRRRSRSRSRRRGRDRQTSNPQLSSLQKEVLEMKDETRRLQRERAAIEAEKAALADPQERLAAQIERRHRPTQATYQAGPAAEKPARPARDEFSGMEGVMDSVMEAVGAARRHSPLAKPSKIIPGAQTFEDLEAFLKRKKDEKLEGLKKKK